MNRCKAILWSLGKGFSYCPLSFLLFLLIQILRTTLSVSVTVLLGEIISEVQRILTTTRDLSQIAGKLILFGILHVVLWLAVEIRWRFSDDYLPLRGEVGATRFLSKLSRDIPLRRYDDAQFCDRYDRFQRGVRAQQQLLKSFERIGNILYALILSCLALFRLHAVFVAVTLLFFLISLFPARKNAAVQDEIRRETTSPRRYASYLGGMFFGIYNRETRLFGLQDRYLAAWAGANREVAEKEIIGSKKISRTMAGIAFLRDAVCPLLLASIALFFVSRKWLLAGSIYMVWNLSRDSLSTAGDALNLFSDCIAQCREAEETYDTYTAIRAEAKPPVSTLPMPNPNAPAFAVRDLEFSYLPEKTLLCGINFVVKKGEIVALLGENGSGKSTLIKLLLGVYFPDRGNVRVFGEEAGKSEEYIREHIGVVFQDFCNYPFTLRENVGFGEVREIERDERIMDSLQFAGADRILQKAETLDRMLGRSIEQDGIELSGGEWQRLAIARAYMGMREILIFDEPAAKLDPLSEEKQFASIMKYARENGKTVILVSHRVGFARMADRILYLKDGKLTESGTHGELMALRGDYARMFAAQREMYAGKEEKAV